MKVSHGNRESSNMERRLLTTKEAAVYLGLGLTKLRDLIASGKLPHIRIDRNIIRLDERDGVDGVATSS